MSFGAAISGTPAIDSLSIVARMSSVKRAMCWIPRR
jgi:hypothetical protein